MTDDSDSEWEPEDALERSSSGDDDGGIELEQLEASPGGEQTFLALLEGANVETAVTKLSQTECCSKKCLAQSITGLRRLLQSLRVMTKAERKTSIYSVHATSSSVASQAHSGKTAKRTRTTYLLPFAGEVCRVAFRLAYGISHKTLNVYRAHVAKGTIAVDPHGNTNKQHAKKLHDECLTAWYKMVGETLGDIVPLRVRRRKMENGTVHHFYTFENYTLLPSTLRGSHCTTFTKQFALMFQRLTDCGLYDEPPEDAVTKAMDIKKDRRAQQTNKRKRGDDSEEGKSQVV